MKIKALVPFSNGTISMEQYEVREVADSLGNELISAGIAVEIGGGLPPVTESDAGKVLAVDNSGVWGAQEPIGKKFIVTLTQTAEDFSGTMDRTVAEINAAYEAGQEIVFRIVAGETTHYDISVTQVTKETDDYPSFSGYCLLTEVFAQIYTDSTMDGTDNTYHTAIYALTPAT